MKPHTYPQNCKQLVGRIEFKSKHLLVMEAILEYDQQGYVKDVLFVEIHADISTAAGDIVRMQLGVEDLCQMLHGAKEVISIGKGLSIFSAEDAEKNHKHKALGNYRKYTKSSRFSSSLFFGVASSLRLDQKGKQKTPYEAKCDYYLNITRDENGQKTTYVLKFDCFGFDAFLDRIHFLATCFSEKLFDAQSLRYGTKNSK